MNKLQCPSCGMIYKKDCGFSFCLHCSPTKKLIKLNEKQNLPQGL